MEIERVRICAVAAWRHETAAKRYGHEDAKALRRVARKYVREILELVGPTAPRARSTVGP